MKFKGTQNYVATEDLKVAVNAAITLQRPLLIKGEPGTGKTVLAIEVAKALKAPLLEWHIKSTTKAQQGLYEYDAVSRLRDSQLGDERVKDIANYIKKGKLWEAFTHGERPVLLIDEIDKADIEFPNDLLQELDRMEFFVYETGETIKAHHRPIVIITSNNEKELPDAFLRRCFFHYIRFPDEETMRRIVEVHYPGLKKELLSEALSAFFRLRETPALFCWGMRDFVFDGRFLAEWQRRFPKAQTHRFDDLIVVVDDQNPRSGARGVLGILTLHKRFSRLTNAAEATVEGGAAERKRAIGGHGGHVWLLRADDTRHATQDLPAGCVAHPSVRFRGAHRAPTSATAGRSPIVWGIERPRRWRCASGGRRGRGTG